MHAWPLRTHLFIALVVLYLTGNACHRQVAAPAPPGVSVKPEIQVGGSGHFETRTIELVGRQPFAVVAVDMNSDGALDLAVSDAAGGVLTFIPGKGDGSFGERSEWTHTSAGELPRGLAVGDLNGDTNPDIAVASTRSDELIVAFGDGKGAIGGKRRFAAGERPFAVAVGDLNGDGKADVVVANETNADIKVEKPGQVDVFLGDGKGRLRRETTLAAGLYPGDVQVADLDGDGHRDIVVANWGDDDASVFFGDGRGRFRVGPRLRPDPASEGPYSVQIADVNGDGHNDVVLSDVGASEIRMMLGDGRGGFTPGPVGASGRACRSVVVADLNGDGLPDMASANTSSGDVVVSFADGEGGFDAGTSFPTGQGPRWVTTADLDGDSRMDLVVTNMGAMSVTVLLNRLEAR